MSIKTSIGTPTANSYVSVASANTYFNARTNADAWTNIASSTSNTTSVRTTKENLLIQATREIDKTYRFFGSKYNIGLIGATDYQNLEFPRHDTTDTNGDVYIPDEIKYSTYEQALWVLERTTPRKAQDGTIVKREFIGAECYQYLKPYVNRQVRAVNNWPFAGSDF